MEIPNFLYEKLLKQYGEELTNKIIEGYSKNRPVTLRINTLKNNIQNVQGILENLGYSAKQVEWCKDALIIEKITESDINIMFELINYRYLNYLPLIVSTEFTVDKLLDFDEAIGSRLYEMSKNYLVEIEGKENNYRLR